MRNSYGGVALLLGVFFVVSTAVVGAQAEAPEYPEAAVFAVNGETVETILADVGLDAAWRSSLDLHPGARHLEIKYRSQEGAAVETLITTAFELSATASEREEARAELRVAAETVEKSIATEREREIDRNRADAYFQGIHALTQSVAIDRFAGRDPSSNAILGLDGDELIDAQREFSLTNSTLEEMIEQRSAAEKSLNEAIAAYEAAVQVRADAEDEHARLVGVVAGLTAKHRALDASARETIPAAAKAYVLADIPGQAGLSPRALSAYLRAEATMSELSPYCHVSWRTLAAIGSVESSHGTYNDGRLEANGQPSRPIIGISLNGQTVDNFGHVTANLPDTDGGKYDGDPAHDRAVGPMQFIPQTWDQWQLDGDGNGDRDPHDIDDAALTAAAYLCNYGSLRFYENWSVAIFGYNHSGPYVNSVKAALDRVQRLRLPEFEGDDELRQRAPYGTWVPLPDEIPLEPTPTDEVANEAGG